MTLFVWIEVKFFFKMPVYFPNAPRNVKTSFAKIRKKEASQKMKSTK